MLDDDACYEALRANDARFDGLFFVGVSSTGIYCRSVCPAKLPKRENCTFFPTAAAAEAAGYRPCLKCRPELAPGQPATLEMDELAARAAARCATAPPRRLPRSPRAWACRSGTCAGCSRRPGA